MQYSYSCFISYYRGKHKLAKQLVTDLRTALEEELELWCRKPIFLDEVGMQGGDIVEKSLAIALCKSVCMIVIYTPSYFDEENTYCAREYYAMEKIERQRLAALKQAVDQSHGLIIPIVFRGADLLTPPLKKRLYFDFENYTLLSETPAQHPEYRTEIRKIAKYIHMRVKAFHALPCEPCGNCDEAVLPTDAEVLPWLNTMIDGQETQPAPWLVGNT